MLAEPLDIDLGPVRGRIRIEEPDDLCNGAEGILTRHRRYARGHPLHCAHVLSVHVAPVPRHGVVTMGPRRWRMLSEDGVREDPPREGDAERDGQDCSPHDLLLSKRSATIVETPGWSNL